MLAGVFRTLMPRRATQRFLAVLTVLAVFSFAFATASHWHSNSTGDEQCQVCHLAHSVSLGVSSTTALLLAPATVARLIVSASTDPKFEFQFREVSPRAPPLTLQLS
jgi:hypothetical protein